MDLKESVGIYTVSTVRLPFGGMGLGSYETMIIKNMESDREFLDYQERYDTAEEAVIGHNETVMSLKKGELQ